MSKAKIGLSQKETELVMDATFILTKNAILEKVKYLLLELQEKQENFLHHPQLFTAADYKKKSPKISKGENYKGLPYLMLDYPRIFDNSTIFAIRTMFWWGNFFSLTLHLSGDYKKKWEAEIAAGFTTLKENNFSCCVNDDQWQHDFETGNYIPLTQLNKAGFKKIIREKSFIKLATKIPLPMWNDATGILFNNFKKIIEILDA